VRKEVNMGVLTSRAKDIYLNDEQLSEALGYLATPGRMRIEAQVPYGKEGIFMREYPGQEYYSMLPTSDKQSFQLRIMMNNTRNCPDFLLKEMSAGGGYDSPGCISRGLFVERIVEDFGFQFTVDYQDVDRIRDCVREYLPRYMDAFERGYRR